MTFSRSASICEFALTVKLYDVYGLSTTLQDMLKQCRSRVTLIVVVVKSCQVKSHPDEKLIFHLLVSFMFPDMFRLCDRAHG